MAGLCRSHMHLGIEAAATACLLVRRAVACSQRLCHLGVRRRIRQPQLHLHLHHIGRCR